MSWLWCASRVIARTEGGVSALKFLVRAAMSPHKHAAWLGELLGSEDGPGRVAHQPHLIWKLQRPYLSAGMPIGRRLAMLTHHQRWLKRRWTAEQVDQLYRHAAWPLASFDAGPSGYDIVLGVCPQFAKEGDLVLQLERSGVRLGVIAFGVQCEDGEWVARIGCVQGGPADQGELTRLATRELHGLRPKQAVLVALKAVLRRRGVTRLYGVGGRAHIYQSKSRRKDRVQLDYDGFWREMGGVERGGEFALPILDQRKAPEDIPSHKRAGYRRRYALQDLIEHQIDASLGPGRAPFEAASAPVPAAVPAAASSGPELADVPEGLPVPLAA